ncbi:MAG: SHOCT domain-containing protein [Parasporobacterium sp.]|nr:SHOCT domain-containing protein [Parasporobacterium sp.]
MALFHKEFCAICGNQVSATRKVKLDNGSVICDSCMSQCGMADPLDKYHLKTMTVEEIKTKIEHVTQEARRNKARIADFVPSLKIGWYIWFDDTHQWFAFPSFVSMKNSIENSYIYRYDELVDCSIVENGRTAEEESISGAIVGAAVLGPIGAIIGAESGEAVCTKLQIKVTTNNPERPKQTVTLIDGEVPKETEDYITNYQFAQKAASKFKSILGQLQQKDAPQSYVGSPADEIKKYKELLDIGALTQEEFDVKKKELLSLKYRNPDC